MGRGGFNGGRGSRSRNSNGHKSSGGKSFSASSAVDRGLDMDKNNTGFSKNKVNNIKFRLRANLPLLTLMIAMVIFWVISTILSVVGSHVSENNTITKSTIQRERLKSVVLGDPVVEQSFIYNKNGNWLTRLDTVISGLRHFYNKTGVMPYLVLMDNLDGEPVNKNSDIDEWAEKYYEENILDENHMLVVFWEDCSSGTGNGDNYTTLVKGFGVNTVIDAEAEEILFDYLYKNYYDMNLSSERWISISFREAADAIMKKDNTAMIAVLVLICVFFVVAVSAVVAKIKSEARIKAALDERILNSPITPLEATDEISKDSVEKTGDPDIDKWL